METTLVSHVMCCHWDDKLSLKRAWWQSRSTYIGFNW